MHARNPRVLTKGNSRTKPIKIMMLCLLFIFNFHLNFPLMPLASAAPSSLHADDFQTCKELQDKEKQTWMQKARVDISGVLHDRLRGTHQDLYPRSDSSRFQQAEFLVRAFDVDTWLERFRSIPPDSIAANRKTQLEFLFSFWVREKYLGLLSRAAARDEQNELKFFGSKVDATTRTQIMKYPAEPRITRIATYRCEGAKDSRTYRCGEPHLAVDIQLSPTLLCSGNRNITDSRLRLIVRLDPLRGPLITDVERDSIRIYQDTLSEYAKLKSKLPGNDLYTELKQRAFFSTTDFNEIPGSGILSLRENEESKRMPASANSRPNPIAPSPAKKK